MENKIKFGIIAYRPNGERVYFCENSNGETMTPYAASLASKFESKKLAKIKMEKLKQKFVFPVWNIFQDI